MKETSKLSRLERIELETQKALAYQQRVCDIPLHENFRVEHAPQDPYNSVLLESSFLLGGNKLGTLVQKNPYIALKSEKSLVECLKSDLELAQSYPTQEVKDRILTTFHQLANQHNALSAVSELRDKVFTVVFGRNFFTNTNEFKMPCD